MKPQPKESNNIIFPPQEIQTFIFSGTKDDNINLEASFVNRNLFSDNYFVWSCFSLTDGCPDCPGWFKENLSHYFLFYFF